jgi:hypothetical protein
LKRTLGGKPVARAGLFVAIELRAVIDHFVGDASGDA